MRRYFIPAIFIFALTWCGQVFSGILMSNENFHSIGSVVCVEDICFEKKQNIKGRSVPLRGVAEVKFTFIKIYSAAFYVPDNVQSIDKILDTTPKQLSIKYHRSFNRKQFIKLAENHLKKNPDVEFDKFKDKIDILARTYESVKPGDRYDLVYYPGEGIEVFFNGESKIKIKGDDFANYYFTIWISSYPYNKKLTKLLTHHIGLLSQLN